ncbi:MAG: polysaccharide deacetylase family protein [Candidatus Margulisbacteria bacterium]|nr:polysaccharide deacetylase family protein [Candidatus Margulisiibacteriota bacterium]
MRRKKNKPLFCLTLLLVLILFSIALNGCQVAAKKKLKYRLGKQVSEQTLLDSYWRNARREVDKSVLSLLVQDRAELRRGIRYHKFFRGSFLKKKIALTFDDGPHPYFTPFLLEILKKYDVKGTFFLVGEMAERYPALIRAEASAGHGIGNHTYDHVNLTKVSSEDAATEIEACGDVIESITGKRPHLFRPPGGDYNTPVLMAAETLGYAVVLWTDNAGDWLSPGKGVIERKVLDRISNGGIILMHDGIQQTIDILPQILTILKREGYQFVTIDEMMPESYIPSLEVNPADL